jgi:membrane associated rhomboid family serine protease
MIPLGDENRSRSTPVVNYLLIAANVLVFLYQIMLPSGAQDQFITRYGFTAANLTSPLPSVDLFAVLTIFTSMFIHADILHILGNMLFLYVFGDNIEDTLGHVQYLLFYFVCGLIATATDFLSDPYTQMVAIGASGAISGVLGAYIVLYPYARIRTVVTLGFFFYIARIPAIFFLGFWFLYQLLYASTPDVSGVAYWAHIGGFLAGFLLIRILPKKQRPLPPPPPPRYYPSYPFPPYSA